MFYQILFLIFLIGATIFLLFKLRKLIIRFYITFQGPFFAPTSSERIKQILQLVNLKQGMKIVDLGSGDGRVLIELVKAYPEITAVGIELDPEYVRLSKANIKAAGLSNKIQIKHVSFWTTKLAEYDLIITYCIRKSMDRLEKKLKNEIKKSCEVISVYFQFKNWKPKKQLGDIRLYRK